MRIAFLGMTLLLVSCGDTTEGNPDAAGDATVMDGGKPDTGTADATMDSSNTDANGDANDDASSGDAADDGASDSGLDAASDAGIIIDAGDPDGGICPPCPMNFACCMLMQSINYGKCTAKACLACCM